MKTVDNKKNTYAWMIPKNTSNRYRKGGTPTAAKAPTIDRSRAPSEDIAEQPEAKREDFSKLQDNFQETNRKIDQPKNTTADQLAELEEFSK